MRILLIYAACITLQSCKEPEKGSDRMGGKGVQNLIELSYDDVPRSLKFKGQFERGLKWTDQNGENILVLSKESKYGGYDESSFLYGVHFVRQNDAYEVLWKMTDHEKDCQFDITCNFLSGATTITDLDSDGFAEVKLQYELACRSDVSSASMKILLYENGKKRALQGTRWMDRTNPMSKRYPYSLSELCKEKYRARDYNGGQYETEIEFLDAPPVILDFVKEEWRKYVVESKN